MIFLAEGETMNVHTILFPTDFSELSLEALPLAASLAKGRGATLLILHVAEPIAVAAGESYYGLREPDRDELLERLQQIKPPDPAVPHAHEVESGDAAAAIMRVAEREGCELIVMATHGRRGLTRLLMGSVAEQVIRGAPCPVLTVKHPVPVLEPALA
jgi:nucleotide-binding universal stress UspA family protein